MHRRNRLFIDRFLNDKPVEYRPLGGKWQRVERLGVFDSDLYEFRVAADKTTVYCSVNLSTDGELLAMAQGPAAGSNLKLVFVNGGLESAEVVPAEIYD